MALIKKRVGCNPVTAGLLPTLAFIAGIIVCNVTVTNDAYVLENSEWYCSKFENGVCAQFTFKANQSVPPDKIMKNDPK